MTDAAKVLTQELQRAVQARESDRTQTTLADSSGTTLRYEPSPAALTHLEKLREYREKAKTVRVGSY